MEQMEQIESGIKIISKLISVADKPADKNSQKEIKESLKLLKKKAKLLKKDEALKAQYLDRTAFDTVQGVFQALHLYIISTDGSKDDVILSETTTWLRTHETAYQIAERMQKAALARADFSGGGKKVRL